MNSKIVKIEKQPQNIKESYLDLSKITLDEVDTIKTALAVLTEEKAEKYGFNWNNNGTREKLLLSFIGYSEQLRGVANG